MKASQLVALSIILSPAILLGQKKEDLVSIQRDVAQLEDQMRQLQKSLDDKMAALTALVQQSIDASNKNGASLAAMQQNVDQKLAEQQTKLVAPVATLGSKVDEMSNDFGTVRENVRELVRHMNDMDGKIADIWSTVRTLTTPAVTPPPPVAGGVPAGAGGTAQQTPEGPPPGMSADLLYTNALGDYNGKKDETAIEEFAHFLKYYPQSANAPNAQYYIGMIYYRAKDWENGAKAFDAVLEQYPKNSKTAESQYMKACSLMNNHEKTAAGKEFKSFLANYPDGPRAKDAHQHLRDLGLEGPSRHKE